MMPAVRKATAIHWMRRSRTALRADMPFVTPMTWASESRRSVGRAPAGQVEHRAGAERAALRAEKQHEFRDLLRLAEARHRALVDHRLHVLRAHLVQERGAGGRRRDGVDQHARPGQLLAERL